MRNHLHSNIVGYVALFFALSLGTAYAVDKNSIKSKHIGAGQVKTSDLGNAAVTNAKLAPSSVDGTKVADDSLKGADVDEGSLNLPQPDIPSTLPPSGPASGDLTGEFPNPQIGAGAVGSGEVDGSLTGDDIVEGSLVGLVAGTGHAVTGRLQDVPGGGGAGQEVLAIPGWGAIEVFTCQPNATPAARDAVLAFDSTGPNGVSWAYGGSQAESRSVAFSSAASPFLGAAGPGNEEANEALTLFLSRDDSAQTVVAHVAESTDATNCDFHAQALIVG